VIAGDQVVAATTRGVLYVLDAKTGAIDWQYDAGGSFTASPVVVDGQIIIGNGDGTLYCFGEKKKGNDE
jgi:outer membrane protein assembly factor BamB